MERLLAISAQKASKARIIFKRLEIFVMPRLSAILRAKPNGCLKVVECTVWIASQAISGSQRIMNVFLVGIHFVGLTEVLESLVKVPAVERCNSARIIAFRRPGKLFMVPLAFAISQVNSRAVSYVPDRTCGKFLKKRSSFFKIPSLEISDRSSKIFQRGCALCIHGLCDRFWSVLYAYPRPHF